VACNFQSGEPSLEAEVLQALQEGTGSAIRWSSTLNVEFIYVAAARSILPQAGNALSEVDALIRDLRSQLALAIFIAVGLTVVFGYVVRGLIRGPLREIAAFEKTCFRQP